MGLQYWNQLAEEHGINSDGSVKQYPGDGGPVFQSSQEQVEVNDRNDRPELFFTLSDSTKYTPRAILIDLEPSVVNKCMNNLSMINPRNVHLSEHGSGAANNWQKGYLYGTNHEEELLNLIDREVDKADNFSNFQLIHSVAGGTGAGVGSRLLEILNDRFGPKKLINTFSIFPSNEKTSDVVVQPYNTILTLKRLIDHSDATFVFHNDALNSIENLLFNNQNFENAFDGANMLISNVCASISNPLRFPNYMYSSYESILSTLIPTSDLKFLSASIVPFQSLLSRHNNLNEYDMILELLNERYKMNRVLETPKYISVMNYLTGNNLNQQEIRKAGIKAQQRLQFVPWTTNSIQMVNCKKSPFLKSENIKQLSGLQLSNNTSITSVFTKILKQYDLLVKREAYINSYTDNNSSEERHRVLDIFNDCKESVLNVIDEYKSCQTSGYLDDEILLEDDVL